MLALQQVHDMLALQQVHDMLALQQVHDMFPSSEIPDQLWSPKNILIKGHKKIFHSVKQTGCEFGHKSAYCPGEE